MTAVPGEDRMNLAEHIDGLLAIGPEDPFAESRGRWWLWGDAAAASAALRALLDSAGCRPGTRIGVLMRNRPEHVATFATVFALRLTLVPFNPHLGAERLAHDIRTLRPPVVVAGEEDWALPGVRETVDAIEAVAVSLGSEPGDAPRTLGRTVPGEGTDRDGDEAIAVEMLTSGTTGPPKRVPLRRSALEKAFEGAHLHQNGPRAEHGPRHRTTVSIVTSPPVHMSGLTGLIRQLGEGRSMVLLDRFTVDEWVDVVQRHRPKVLNLVPAALRMILDAGVPRDVLSSARVVTTGTAPASPELVEEFETRYGVPVLINYGATEFSGGVAGWSLSDHRQWRATKLGSVGKAYPGVRMRIVDDAGEPLPPGTRGILEVGMPSAPDGRFQRTNDVATIDADGFLWIHGRADGAINRGGFKIIPEEVQRVLEEHPAVREASVVGIADRRLGEVPVAAVELRSDVEPVHAEALLAFARDRLTGYQMPARLLIVPALPRTSGLKVAQADVRALFGDGSPAAAS